MTEESPPPATDPAHRRSSAAEDAAARARRFRRRAVLVPVAAILGLLVIGEVAARVAGTRPVERLVADGKRGWAYEPGTVTFAGVPATIAPGGTRGPQGSPGGVLILGDQVALGAGLEDDATVAAALKRGGEVSVTLAACEDYGTAQQLAWARELSDRVRPRAVIVLLRFDDLEPFAATIFTSLRVSLQRRSALAAAMFRPGPPSDLQELFDPDGVPWRLWAGTTLPAFRSWSRDAGIRVLVAPWPPMRKETEALAEFYQQVRGETKIAGLEFVDLRPALGPDPAALAGPGGLPGAEAHKRVAEALAAALRE